jgi:hypothetical protein
MALTHVAYRASIRAARGYSTALARAIDLYRFEALERLRLALPADHLSEQKLFPLVDALIKNRRLIDPQLLSYRHDPSATIASYTDRTVKTRRGAIVHPDQHLGS